MEIDAVPAILELVAEGHGNAVLSPRALSQCRGGARLCARAIVQPRLASRLAVARRRSVHRRRSSSARSSS
jgi:LysR family nitrogen assimilation transcriptional regulator